MKSKSYKMKKLRYLSLLLIFSILPLFSETLIVLNRTGFDLFDLRVMGDSQSRLSENLIPYDVILDQGYWEMEWDSPEGVTLVMIDEMGDRYVKRIESPLSIPKTVVTLDDLQLLEEDQGVIAVRLSNQLGYPVTELFLSSSGSEHWGSDQLKGKILRQGELLETTLPAGGLYDIRFWLHSADGLKEYRLNEITLRDRGLFVLEIQ